jgi:hypothetical protein
VPPVAEPGFAVRACGEFGWMHHLRLDWLPGSSTRLWSLVTRTGRFAVKEAQPFRHARPEREPRRRGGVRALAVARGQADDARTGAGHPTGDRNVVLLSRLFPTAQGTDPPQRSRPGRGRPGKPWGSCWVEGGSDGAASVQPALIRATNASTWPLWLRSGVTTGGGIARSAWRLRHVSRDAGRGAARSFARRLAGRLAAAGRRRRRAGTGPWCLPG